MAASDSLNQSLFHGTHRRFKPGDVILPATGAGVRPNWGRKSKNDPELAYSTPDMDTAQYFAKTAHFLNRENRTSRARVYEVAPVNPENTEWSQLGKTDTGDPIMQQASREGYRVIRRAWIGRS